MPASTVDRGQLYPQPAGHDPSIMLLRAVDPERVAAEWEALDSQLDALDAERDARYLDQITHTYDEYGRGVVGGPLRWCHFAGRTDLDPESDAARDIRRGKAVARAQVEDALVVELPTLAPPDAVARDLERQLRSDVLIDIIAAAVDLLMVSPGSLLRFQAVTERALTEETRSLAAGQVRLRMLAGHREGGRSIRASLGRQAARPLQRRRARQRREAADAARRDLRSQRLRIGELQTRLAAIDTREETRGTWLRRHRGQLACGAAAVVALNERDLMVELDSRGLEVRDADGQVLEHAVRVVRVLASHLPAYFGGVDLPNRHEWAVRSLVLGASLGEVIDRCISAGRRHAARAMAIAFPSAPARASETAAGGVPASEADKRLGPLPPGPEAVFARLNPDWDLPPAGHPLGRTRCADQADNLALGMRAAGCLRTENSDVSGLRESTASAAEEPTKAGGVERAQ